MRKPPPGLFATVATRLASALLLLDAAHAAAQAAPPDTAAQARGGNAVASCRAESGAKAPTVIELYTSEGCSSCPPADRWLSTLKGRGDVIALGFHVSYWDRLGWPDRFASAEFTSRQYRWADHFRSAQVYTPQVIASGRDWRGWPKLPPSDTNAASPKLTLQRDGDAVIANVAAFDAPQKKLSGYWAVTEDAHATRVRAGENAGETLSHDHVVRLIRPLPDWTARDGQQSRLEVARGVAAHPRRVIFVVTDAATSVPLQAVALGC